MIDSEPHPSRTCKTSLLFDPLVVRVHASCSIQFLESSWNLEYFRSLAKLTWSPLGRERGSIPNYSKWPTSACMPVDWWWCDFPGWSGPPAPPPPPPPHPLWIHAWCYKRLHYYSIQKKMHKIVIILLPISSNMCFECLKEPSHWDRSFEYPQHMFWLRNKKNIFQLRTLIICYNLSNYIKWHSIQHLNVRDLFLDLRNYFQMLHDQK